MNSFSHPIFHLRCGSVATLTLSVLLLAGPVVAQSPAAIPVEGGNAGVDEYSRLMQAYMARRTEWIEHRALERQRASAAKDAAQRRDILRQLDDAARVMRSEAAELARQLKASAKKKQDDAKPRG